MQGRKGYSHLESFAEFTIFCYCACAGGLELTIPSLHNSFEPHDLAHYSTDETDEREVEMYRDVVIFHAGDDVNVRSFAQFIADKISSFAEPHLINVDELARQDQAKLSRPVEFEGAPIYVISPILLQQPDFRNKLIASTPGQNTAGRNMPWRPGFYICHNVTLQEIFTDYPDLRNLCDDVMIGEEKDLPELIEELRHDLAEVPKLASLGRRISNSILLFVAYAVYCLGIISSMAYGLRIVSSLWLLGLLISKWEPPSFEIILICHVLFAAGYAFSRIPSLDFWEYLGTTWKFNYFLQERYGATNAGTEHLDAEYTDRVHGQTISKWMRIAQAAQLKQLVTFSFLIVPGLISAWATRMLGVAAGGFLMGLIMPVLWSLSLHYLEKWRSLTYGMSAYEIARTQTVFHNTSTPTGTSKWTVHRPWLPKRPWIFGAQWIQAIQAKVFISHAWNDDKETPVANDLYQIAKDLSLPCFLDKKGMTSRFATFRAQLAHELGTSTHFFVVLGQHARNSQAVHREIRTAMQRRYTGLEPSIICVVEPELAAELMQDNTTVPEINYLLRDCPKLTYSEARNPKVIDHIIRQRCRHGLIEDWIALINPASALRRYLSNEIRSMSQIDET